MTDHIQTSIKDGVQHIQINRPEKKNALTSNMYAAMAKALETSNQQDEIKVNLIYGVPGCFTAGNDIEDFLKFARTGNLDESVLQFLSALAELEKPLILAIDGPAVGIGTTMIFHSDLAYATEAALFQTPFLDLGLIPEAASSYLMPRTIGHHKAFEMLALGTPYTAKQATEAGFINAIFEPDQLIEASHKNAARLAKKPPSALKIARNLLRKRDKETIHQVMQTENQHFKNQLKSEEAKAAFFAFLNK